MRYPLESVLGLYSPSFFKMYISLREHIDDVFNLSEEASAAFIHEYIHFLQDITTIYGQKNIISVVDFIRTVNWNQRESGNETLPIPYVFEPQRDGGTYYNSELQRLLVGTIKLDYSGTISDITILTTALDLGHEIQNIVQVALTLPGLPNQYIFGSHAVLESMAYEVEQALYPNVLEKPRNFCYFAAVEIVRYCHPNLLEDRRNIISLCDAALMYYNPGALFYHAAKLMQEVGFMPNPTVSIYDFVFENFPMQFHGLTQVVPIFNNHTVTAISLLEGYFTTDLFAANRSWMSTMLMGANDIRRQRWNFFSELANGGPLQTNGIFRGLFGRLGMPMVVNADALAFFASPALQAGNFRPEILWAISQIYNIYLDTSTSQSRRCGLQDWCRESCQAQGREDITDSRCWDEPWSRVHDTELCVFAQIWKTWGLERIVPTTRQRIQQDM